MKKYIVALLGLLFFNHALATPVTVTVQHKKPLSNIQYDGYLQAAHIVELQSPANGILLKIHAKLGDKVERDQLLFEFSSVELQTQLTDASIATIEKKTALTKLQSWSKGYEMTQALAAVDKAKHELARTEARFLQTQKLYQHGVISKEECLLDERFYKDNQAHYKNARRQLAHVKEKADATALSLAQLQFEQAKNKEKQLQQKIKALSIFAPFSGMLIAPPHSENAKQIHYLYPQRSFQEKEVIAWLADMSALCIHITVDEFDIVRLQPDQAASITFAAFPASLLTGKVFEITTQHHQAKDSRRATTYDVKIALGEIPKEILTKLLIGMTAAVQISESLPEGLWIAKTAVHYENNQPYVHKKSEQSWVKQNIMLADNTPHEVRVIQGLNIGDEIIIHG